MRNLRQVLFGTTAVVLLATPCLATTRFLTLPYNEGNEHGANRKLA